MVGGVGYGLVMECGRGAEMGKEDRGDSGGGVKVGHGWMVGVDRTVGFVWHGNLV